MAAAAITSRSGRYGAGPFSTVASAAQAVAVSGATVYSLTLSNADASHDAWLMIYNAADTGSVTVGTTPAFPVYIPKNSSITHSYGSIGVEFTRGMVIAVTAAPTGASLTSSTAFAVDINWTTAVGSGA